MAGCGGSGTKDNSGSTSGTDATETGSGAMGRYVEAEEALPEGVTHIVFMAQLPCGSLRLLGDGGGQGVGPWSVLSSTDGGKSWTPVDYPWLAELTGTQVSVAALTQDGAYIVQPDSEEENAVSFSYGDANGLAPIDANPMVESETPLTAQMYAAPNGDLIYVIEIADKNQAVVRFEVPEFDAPQVRLGQAARVTVGGMEGKAYTGKVTKIYEQAVEKVDSDDDEYVVPVEITLEDADDALKVGYTVNAELLIEESGGTLCIFPLGVVFPEGDGYFVYVITNGLLEKRPVTLGFTGDRSVEVLEGLQEGDVVVQNPDEVEPAHLSVSANMDVQTDEAESHTNTNNASS